MAKFRERHRDRPRSERGFRPLIDEANAGGAPLDQRLLLSGPGKRGLHLAHPAARIEALAAHASHIAKSSHAHSQRLTPIEKIDAEYNAFLNAFNQQLDSYVASLNQSSTNTTTVSATVTAAYAAGSPVIEVSDASVFGPAGTFGSPVLATATVGSAPPIGQFTLTGSSGDSLTVNTADSSSIPMAVGTVLTATVPVSASSSAASIFPSYITSSTIQMGINLVEYFNNLPVKLPQQNAPPHTPTKRGAIQKYVYMSIAGNGDTYGSLQKTLEAITLPTTPGSDLDIYMATVNSAVQASRQQVLSGIEQIYAGTLLVPVAAPANRLGETFNSSSTGGSATSSASSGSSTTA